MKINNVRLERKNGMNTLTGDLTSAKNKPLTLFYSIPSAYADFINPDASSFLVAALLPCLKTGESLEVEGTVSRKLFRSLNKIMNLLESWNLGFRRIPLRVSKLLPDSRRPQHRGVFFSGGVDSYYTFLKNRHGTDSIDTWLFIHGFDIPLADNQLFEQVTSFLRRNATQEKVRLLEIKTNVRELLDPYLPWDFAHGAALASAALALRGGLKLAYFSDSRETADVTAWGIHPTLDPLWSTESLRVIHFGSRATRLDKVKYVARSASALGTLRVCWRNKLGHYNCGECEKCLRTMIQLAAIGKLADSRTFDRPLTADLIHKLHFKPSYLPYYSETLGEFKKRNLYPELVAVLEEVCRRNLDTRSWRSVWHQLRQQIGLWDSKFLNGKVFYSLSRKGYI